MAISRRSEGIRHTVLFIALVGAVVGGLFLLKGLLSPAHTSYMLKSIDAVSYGVSLYAGTNGGQIPPQRDLLAALTARGAAPDHDPEKLGGYALTSVERIDAEHYRIRVTCPETEDGIRGCSDILRARSPRTSANVIAVSGDGAATISIDFRL